MQTQPTKTLRHAQPLEFARIADLKCHAAKCYREACQMAHASVVAAAETGRLFLEIKNQVDHGEWLPWLESAGIPRRTASDWIKVSHAVSQMGSAAHFTSIRQALKSLPPKPAKAEAQIPILTTAEKELIETDKWKAEAIRFQEQSKADREAREELERVAEHFKKKSNHEAGYAEDRSIIAGERERTRQKEIRVGEVEDENRELKRENFGLRSLVKKKDRRIAELEGTLLSQKENAWMEG